VSPQSEIRNLQSTGLNPEPRTPNPPRNHFAGPGRPRKLDEIALREVCALVSAGCGIEGAARYVGCAASTIRREALRNDKFAEELRRAHLTAELSPLHAMRQAAAKHWRAAAWLLERTNPQRFAKQNLALFKPDQLREYGQVLMDIIREEAMDPQVRLRIARRLEELHRQAEREIWATRLDPCPRPRQKRKSQMRSASLLPPIDYQSQLDSSHAPFQT